MSFKKEIFYQDSKYEVMFLVENGGQFAITKPRLFKCIKKFTAKKENIQIKNSDIFNISAQNINCGYSLEPPWQGGSNENSQTCFF